LQTLEHDGKRRLRLCRDKAEPRFGTFGSDYVLEPVAYGLNFAGSFSGGTLLKTDFSTKVQPTEVNATAYAAKLRGDTHRSSF
jgi:hypothetical protein